LTAFSPGVIFFPHEMHEGMLLSSLTCRRQPYLKFKKAPQLA